MTTTRRGDHVLSVPSVPTYVTATPGDGRVRLTWRLPVNLGGISGTELLFQYRYAPGATVPDGTAWSNAIRFAQHRGLFDGLTNGTAHAFEVRAVNQVGPGPPATATATPMTVACPAPVLGNRRQRWSGELTIDAATPPDGAAPAAFGFLFGMGSLSDTDFTLGAQVYDIVDVSAGDFVAGGHLRGDLVLGFR